MLYYGFRTRANVLGGSQYSHDHHTHTHVPVRRAEFRGHHACIPSQTQIQNIPFADKARFLSSPLRCMTNDQVVEGTTTPLTVPRISSAPFRTRTAHRNPHALASLLFSFLISPMRPRLSPHPSSPHGTPPFFYFSNSICHARLTRLGLVATLHSRVKNVQSNHPHFSNICQQPVSPSFAFFSHLRLRDGSIPLFFFFSFGIFPSTIS